MKDKIKISSQDSFESDTKTGVTLVDFYADWCGPCRMLSPILEELAGELEGRVRILKVDIDQAQKVAISYQITSVPTLILLKDGKLVAKMVGLRDKKAILEFIDNALKP